ncbi:uncharacterized protein LOC124313970 isoform X1 [Daphnia pulicaria]|uniref:uncharacterized protein LOC124313970 isoform X1 n=2 Tax=Daphnia pulicaria TaxID=35523 RepID=UPI001EEBD70E|nr:uncharacterized protein LOC124313970 isoform X1 [Daphnia pulicaria]
MYNPSRTRCTLLFCLFTVELLLPSCTQQSAIGHTRADDAMKTDGLTMVFTEVISSGSKGSTYESVRNQAKREKRSQFGEIMSQKNFSEFWNSNDTASISRWLEILGMLPKTVRLAFLTVILPDEISVPDLLQLNSNTIAMLKNEFSRLLTDKQVSDIILSLLHKKDYRQAAQVIESLNFRINDGNPDLFLSLWNDQRFGFDGKRCNKDVQSFLRQGLRLLPSPDNWNNTLVKKYGFSLISALPPDILIRIRDRCAARTVLDWWLPQDYSEFGCDFPPDSSDSVISVQRVQLKLMMEVLGENISQWSTANISFYFSLFRRMSPRLLAMMNEQILNNSLSFLSQIRNWNNGQGYALVESLFTNSFRQRINGDRLSNITDRLMYLGPYLLPEFLVNNKNESAPALLLSVWASKIESLVHRGMSLPRMTASALLQYRLSGIAEKDVNNTFEELPLQFDATYLKVAPWKFWKMNLAPSHSTNKDIFQMLDADPLADSLSSGQINRLSQIAARVFRNSDGSWSMANTPAIYWGGANLSDYMSLSAKEILPLINKLTSVVANNLNGAQLGVIYTKLRDDQADLSSATNSAQIIKSMIPVPYLKSRYTLNQLQDLAADMPIDSIVRLTYAATKLDGTYNISIADLVRQPLLVPHLSPEHLNSIPVVDTADLMKAVSLSAQGPPVQMIMILQTRLRSYTRHKRHDVANTDVSLLENVWLSDYDIFPATVIADFSVIALKSISGMKKIELLRSLGRLYLNDYYTIPRYKRINILQQGIAAMVKDGNGRKLNEEDMAIIGNAVVDMEEARINNMTTGAFEIALPILQGNVKIFGGLSVRPCTTSDQRSAIRKSLKTFYGYPNAWNLGTVAVACCSLNTLSWRELESIRDDLFLEGCRSCNADAPPPFHLQILRQNLQAACQFELSSMELENDVRQGNELVAKKRAIAAFNTFAGDRVQVFGIQNQQLFVGNERRRLSCEAVVPSGSAAGFTVDQLISLSSDDIQDCLYELGHSPLNSDQGTALWNRVLQVYENDASRIPKNQLTRLGWILPSVDMESLDKFRMNDSDVLAALGAADFKISMEKMKVLSNRAVLEWEKDPETYTGQDLLILGRLLCGVNAPLIDRISPIAYLEASAYLGMLLRQPRCSDEVLSSLANKAIDFRVFGAPSNWTAAIVRNIGAVIGGLSPEQLRLIPANSLLGLTPSAVMSIPDNNFKAFKTQQIRNFPLAVAQTVLVRERQRYGLVDEMRDALNYVIYGSSENIENSSRRNTGSGIIFIIVITFVTVRRF